MATESNFIKKLINRKKDTKDTNDFEITNNLSLISLL